MKQSAPQAYAIGSFILNVTVIILAIVGLRFFQVTVKYQDFSVGLNGWQLMLAAIMGYSYSTIIQKVQPIALRFLVHAIVLSILILIMMKLV